MSLRTRLTLLFTAIVSLLLALFCGLLYGLAERYRGNEFQNRLQAEAQTAGHLLVGKERMGPTLYKLLDKNQLTVLPQEEIIIYDANNKLIYESGTDYLTVSPATLADIRSAETPVLAGSEPGDRGYSVHRGAGGIGHFCLSR